MIPVAIYLGLVAVLSGISFLAYGWDKWCAQCGSRRIPEKTFHLLALAGGWPGAWMGQQRFRHKTRKVEFQAMFWSMVVLHCCVVAFLGYPHWQFSGGPSAGDAHTITPINR